MPPPKRKLDDLTAAEGQTSSQPTSSTNPNDKMSDTQATKPEMGNDSVFNSPVVTIAVGANKIQYFVHEQVLAKDEAGRFFNKVFTNGFQETQTRYLELPEDDLDAFDVFVKWLYGSYCTGNTMTSTEFYREDSVSRLIRCYIFAHKYMINGLQDHLISEVFDLTKACFWWDTDIDRNTLEQLLASASNSHMHKLLSRWLVEDIFQRQGVKRADCIDDIPEEFLRLVTKEMFKVEIPDKTDTFADFCGEKRNYLLRGD